MQSLPKWQLHGLALRGIRTRIECGALVSAYLPCLALRRRRESRF
jgi:hypothetical protein